MASANEYVGLSLRAGVRLPVYPIPTASAAPVPAAAYTIARGVIRISAIVTDPVRTGRGTRHVHGPGA
jgi:hypothetical protein